MDGHPSRRSCRPMLVAVAAILAALALVPAAGAHTRLITTEPANDAVLEQSPRFVLLRFDEPVETAFGAIRVYDPRARRVDVGQGRAAKREGSPHQARTPPRSRHVHRDVAGGLGRRASGLGGVRLPRRRPECEPGRRCGPGARERDAEVGDGRVLDRPGARLPAPAPRRRRDADARRRSRAGARRDTVEVVDATCGLRRWPRRDCAGRNRSPGGEGRRLRNRPGTQRGRHLVRAGDSLRRGVGCPGRPRGRGRDSARRPHEDRPGARAGGAACC